MSSVLLGPPMCALTLTAPIADQDLLNHWLTVLKQLLPALSMHNESLELAITQMAAAITQNTNDA
jgi:hypothetical protein